MGPMNADMQPEARLSVPAYALDRADYAPSEPIAPAGATVSAVAPESPAWDAGIEPGMVVTMVNGSALDDMITWLWESDDDEVDLVVYDPRDQTSTPCTLERYPGEDWGIEFDGAIFDAMRTCVNACVFCFMTMLPPGSRDSLSIRDDDYRLSFLQGNFVTLTNMTDEDVDRVIRLGLSPINVSLHAVTPDVRRRVMGKNEHRGIEVLERLMQASIEIHAQIVLCPGINDGEELDRTLAYCEAHEQITSLGIVPLGFTRHQRRFTTSYSDDPVAARRVIEQVRPYQLRALERFGRHTFQMSDEFYLDAGIEVPPASWYDGYPQYYDGIGMIRSYLDDTAALLAQHRDRLASIGRALADGGLALAVVSGTSAASTVSNLIEAPELGGTVIAIRNAYFGGNVDVTGLICGCDLLDQLPADLANVVLILPSVMFNSDGLTLDGYHGDEIRRELERRGARVHIASTMPFELADTLEHALGLIGPSQSVKEQRV